MASSSLIDIWGWINGLPSINLWRTNSTAFFICSSNSSTPSMKLLLTKTSQKQGDFIVFSIQIDFEIPISLWSSAPLLLKPNQTFNDTRASILLDLITGILKYDPCHRPSVQKLASIEFREDLESAFNLVFLTLAFMVSVYEAPQGVRGGCLETLTAQLTSARAREASKTLLRALGADLEGRWMRSLNLAITNQLAEAKVAPTSSLKAPSVLFSYAVSANGFWKVQCYCPIIAMKMESEGSGNADERLLFSLNYQQLQGVVQLGYTVAYNKGWFDVVVGVDNIRLDVNALVPETLLNERGHGSEEKHFPSRIYLQLTPNLRRKALSVSVARSSENPSREIGFERSIEGSFDPNPHIGISVAASESATLTIRPWKFEQSVSGDTVSLNWFLHDAGSGKEVSSSKPSKMAMLQPKAWFRDRYSSAYRPFTKQGGVVFAGDEYGEKIGWRICEGEMAKAMEWEIKGRIWLTYWPNRQRTFYSETRMLEFRELLYLPLNN